MNGPSVAAHFAAQLAFGALSSESQPPASGKPTISSTANISLGYLISLYPE